jgi:hypothetical protein
MVETSDAGSSANGATTTCSVHPELPGIIVVGL